MITLYLEFIHLVYLKHRISLRASGSLMINKILNLYAKDSIL